MGITIEDMERMFNYQSVPPYRAEPYDAVRGITWTIADGNNRHIATVFEKHAAMLIAQRLNS